jgi:hypothetical protein
MTHAYIAEAFRTPVGKRGGSLSQMAGATILERV